MKPDSRHINLVASTTDLPGLMPGTLDRLAAERQRLIKDLSDTPFIAPRIIAALARVAEGAFVAVVALLNLARFPGIDYLTVPSLYAAVIAYMTLAFPMAIQVSGGYQLTSALNPINWIAKVIVSWTLLFSTILLFIFAFKVGPELSRNWLLSWAASGLALAVAFRFLLTHVVRHLNRKGRLNRRAVLVGGGPSADHVIATLNASHDTGMTVLGVFDDRGEDRAPISAPGLQKLGTVSDLIDFVRSTRIDTLILTLPVTAENRLLDILKRLWVLPVDIRLSAQDQRLRYRPRAYSYVGNLALLDIFDRPLGDWGPFVKAAEDKIIAAIAVVLLAPVMAAVAMAVKLESKGPVLFKQKRYGFNNELIEVYKFRSMYADASDMTASKLVTKGDPRVTRVGRIIRKTSLDELPQLFNVLKGELSLVGPRPHATKASAAGNLYETVVDGYFARHKVKPGMTGWAQVNGWRGETDTPEKIERRVEHDLYYIENWSLLFDIYILAITPIALLNTDKAY